MRIAILRVGPVDTGILHSVQDGVRSTFPGTECVIVGETMAIPREAFHTARHQHHSTTILNAITDCARKLESDRVLGVTDVDLYVPRLSFVFGEAQYLGKAAIISVHRLRPEFYGKTADEELFTERSIKEAVHEIGHTLGLEHCKSAHCVMFFSNSILDTDRKKAAFCEKCYPRVMRSLRVG